MNKTYDYPGVIWTLIRTDFKVRYHGSTAGFFWTLLNPMVTFAALLFIFSFVFPGQKGYAVNLIVGVFIYDFFQEATKTGLMSLLSKGYLSTRVQFPPWLLIVTSASNALIRLLVFALAIFIYHIVGAEHFSPIPILLLLYYLLCMLAIVIGFSLGASVLFLYFRDLNQIWDVATAAGFFIAPIIYPLDVLPEKYHFYLYLWPPTPVIDFSRAVLFSNNPPTVKANFLIGAMALGFLAVGAGIYRLKIRGAVERI